MMINARARMRLGWTLIQAYDAAEILLDEYGVDLLIGPACCAAAARASVLAEARGVPLVSWACSANYLSDKVTNHERRLLPPRIKLHIGGVESALT